MSACDMPIAVPIADSGLSDAGSWTTIGRRIGGDRGGFACRWRRAKLPVVQLDVDLDEARHALTDAARRVVGLLRGAGDGNGGRPVVGSCWTVGDVAVHLAVTLLGFTGAADGDHSLIDPYVPEGGTFAERVSAVTAGTLGLETERRPAVLAGAIEKRVQGFLAATAGRAGGEHVPTPWYQPDATLGLGAATALLAGEQLVHGFDLARTLGRSWPIDPPAARLVIRAATSMMPLAVNPAALGGLRARYDLRVVGGPHFEVYVESGRLLVEAPGSGPADCHLAAEPVVFLLLGYGRISQWGPVARGHIRVWGRRPWLALRFKNLFFNP